jgi:phage terminase small subunit
MPRKLVAALSVVRVDGRPNRLKPPASVSEPERETFVAIVTACDARPFRSSDIRLLYRYFEVIVLGEQASRQLRQGGAVVDGKPSPWITVQEKAVRAMVSLSMRLRLSPQSRADSKTIALQKSYRGRPPWMPGEH